MIVFYYDKEKAEQGILFCLGQEDRILTQEEIKEQGKEELYSNVIIYESEIPFMGYPIVDNNSIRPASQKELVDLGILSLMEGEVIVGDDIVRVDIPDDIIKPVWFHSYWVDGATEDEVKIWYFDLIDGFKKRMMENGCWYIDEQGKKHRQKVRPEKDVSLLCSTIYKLDTKIKKGDINPVEFWAFEDGDIKEITLDQALDINLKCGDFLSAVYKVEAILKSKNADRNLTFEKFAEMIDSLTETKTYSIKEVYKTSTFGNW